MSVPSSSQNGPGEQGHSPEEPPPDGEATETVTDSVECPNCGRTFSGTYCPDCGEEVGGSLTMGDVAGDAFREVSEIGGGFQATLVGFTVRPGEVLQEYLSGVRRRYMSPGRYLAVAVMLMLGITQGVTWLDLQKPLADSVMIMEQSSGFMKEVTQLTQSQWYVLATVFISAGILGFLFRRIFAEKLRRGAEALAVGVFLVSHATVLSAGIRLLLVPSVFLWKGTAVDPSVPTSVSSLIAVLYPAVAAYRGFGTNWKSAVKGVLGSAWAYIETIGIVGITVFWYVFLTTPRLREGLSGEAGIKPLVVVGIMTVIYLIPLFLHAGMEAYYRLR